jgi:hypothetical protein
MWTSKSPQFSTSRSSKHLRTGSVHMPHHILTTWMEPRGFIKPLVHNQVVYMKLSLCLSFLPQAQPRGLHSGHHHRIPNQDCGGFSPMISLLNHVEVPTVTTEYLFCPPSSNQLQPPAQWMAWGILSGSSTPGTVGHRLQPQIMDTTGSLQ